MDSRKLTVAVVGVGLHGENHALTYSDYFRCELAGVYDVDASRAAAVASRYGCKALSGLDEVLDDNIDAVSVATPDDLHFEVVEQLLRAGKDVLCEKPLTTSVAEAESLVSTARGMGRTLAVNFAQRFNGRWLAAKEAVESGEIGVPVMGYAQIVNAISVPTGMLGWSARSGPEWFILPHIADVTRWVLGRDPEQVYAVGEKKVLVEQGIDAYDAIQAIVRFGPTSPFVTFATSWIMPSTSRAVTTGRLELVGTQGSIQIQMTDDSVEVYGKSRQGYLGTIPLARRDYNGRLSGFYFEAIRAFVDDILDERQTVARGEDGLAITRLVEAIRTSVVSGRVVES